MFGLQKAIRHRVFHLAAASWPGCRSIWAHGRDLARFGLLSPGGEGLSELLG